MEYIILLDVLLRARAFIDRLAAAPNNTTRRWLLLNGSVGRCLLFSACWLSAIFTKDPIHRVQLKLPSD